MDEGMTRPAVKPHGPWTADTERAFLIALRLTGQPKKAAAEIGRSANAAYTRRKRDAGFAARWAEAVEAQQAEWIAARQAALGPGLDAAGGGRLTPGREREGGWDSRRRGLFLRTLARTKRVDAACAAAEMPARAAHDLRGRSVRFAAAWEKALRDAAPSVIDAAYARAVEGWDEPIVQGGQVVGQRRRYSEGLLRDLLKREQPALPVRRRGRGGDDGDPPPRRGGNRSAGNDRQAGRVTEAELNESLLKKLALLDARIQREEAEQQAGEWERAKNAWGSRGSEPPGMKIENGGCPEDETL